MPGNSTHSLACLWCGMYLRRGEGVCIVLPACVWCSDHLNGQFDMLLISLTRDGLLRLHLNLPLMQRPCIYTCIMYVSVKDDLLPYS